MEAPKELIPPWPVVQARLAENLLEQRLLRRLYRLSRDAAEGRHEHKTRFADVMPTAKAAG